MEKSMVKGNILPLSLNIKVFLMIINSILTDLSAIEMEKNMKATFSKA
jgi:hypothetical protein